MYIILAHLAKIFSTITFLIAGSLSYDYLTIFSSWHLAFLAYLVSLPLLILLYYVMPSDSSVNTKYKGRYCLYGMRIASSVGAKYCWLEGLRHIGVTNMVSLLYLVPIFSVLISVSALKEKLRAYWIVPLLLTIIGSVIIIRSNLINSAVQTDVTLRGCMLALIASACYGLYNVICRKQAQHEHYILQTLYTSAGNSIIFLLIIAFMNADFKQFGLITSPVSQYGIPAFIMIMVVSVLTIITVVLNFFAFKFAKVTELAAHDYLRLVFTILYMYFLKGEVPDIMLVCGTLLIIFGNAAMFKVPVTDKR